MRAILIDPFRAEISEAHLDCAPTYSAVIDRLKGIIGAEVDVPRDLPGGHELWTDDSGLVKAHAAACFPSR